MARRWRVLWSVLRLTFGPARYLTGLGAWLPVIGTGLAAALAVVGISLPRFWFLLAALAIVAILALGAAYVLQAEVSRTLNLDFEYAQPPIHLPLDFSDPKVGTFFWLHGITITNRSTTHRVSLKPVLLLKLKDGRSVRVAQKAFPLVERTFDTTHPKMLHEAVSESEEEGPD